MTPRWTAANVELLRYHYRSCRRGINEDLLPEDDGRNDYFSAARLCPRGFERKDPHAIPRR